MPTRSLSPEEIASLMGGAAAPAPRGAAALSERQELCRRIADRHATLARSLATALEGVVGAGVVVEWLGGDELPLGQLQWTMPPPTCLGLARRASGGFPQVIQLDLTILFPLLDRLLNGSGQPPATAWRRPLTELEQRLALRLLRPLATAWDRAWSPAPRSPLEVERVLTHPQRLDAWTLETPVIVHRYRLTLDGVAGQCQLFAPTSGLAQLLDTGESADAAEPVAGGSGERLPGAHPGEWTIELPPQRLPLDELESLQPGDVIRTDHPVSAPLQARSPTGETLPVQIGMVAGERVARRAD